MRTSTSAIKGFIQGHTADSKFMLFPLNLTVSRKGRPANLLCTKKLAFAILCYRAEPLLHLEIGTVASAGCWSSSAQTGLERCAQLIQNLFSQENLTSR